jgi:hypothetical protein
LQGGKIAAREPLPKRPDPIGLACRLEARGCSSDGRALQSHCRGQGFDSPQLHQPSGLINNGMNVIIFGRLTNVELLKVGDDDVEHAYVAWLAFQNAAAKIEQSRRKLAA